MALRLVPRPDVPTLEAAGDVPGLLELLSHPDPETQREASRALSRLGRRATGDLLGVIGHPDPGVRLGVVEVLGESGNPGAAGPLVRLLGTEKNRDVRMAAALALGNTGDAGAVPALVQALQDPDKYVRFGAATALGKLGWQPAGGDERALLLMARDEWDSLPPLGGRAVHPVLWATRDADPAVRARAVDILGSLGDARVAGACDLVLRDPDSEVRWRATLALPRCGIPLRHLPLGLVRRPRAGKSPAIAAILNLFFLGLGYSYLDRWYGLLIFQVNLTAIVLASLIWGPLLPALASYTLSALLAVQTWLTARRARREAMG